MEDDMNILSTKLQTAAAHVIHFCQVLNRILFVKIYFPYCL